MLGFRVREHTRTLMERNAPDAHDDRSPGAVPHPTHEQAHERAREIAAGKGREASDVSMSDYMQAKRELTGESDGDRQEAILDSIQLPERWEAVPESTGIQFPESPSEGEDEDGLSDVDQLAEEGVEKATRERMDESAREKKIEDKETE